MSYRETVIGAEKSHGRISNGVLPPRRPHLQMLRTALSGIFLLLCCMPVWSQSTPEPEKTVEAEGAGSKLVAEPREARTLRGDEIQQLVQTLEDPEAREKFLAKLRFLADARETTAEEPRSEDAQVSAGGADSPWSAGIESIRKVITQGDVDHLFLRIAFSLALICVGVLIWMTLKRYWFKRTGHPLLARLMVAAALVLVVCIAIFFIWGVPLWSVFTGSGGEKLIKSIGIIVLATIGGWICWWLINSYMTKRMYQWQSESVQGRRLQTLLPLFRIIVRVVIITMVILLVLGELNINILPLLLTGVGVLGIALGFGAQTLVKDVIAGFIVLAKNAVNVQDWVVLGTSSGQVESLTIRDVKLRDIYGNVHIVPWGSTETVINQTKDYGYAVFEAGFAYRENIDEVVEVIKKVAAEMQTDPHLNKDIWSDLQILGTIELGDSAVVVRTRFRTAPFRRWFLERDFRRRVKNRFDELGIEIPYPHATVYFGENKEGTAPPARVQLHGDAEKTQTDSE